MYKLTIKEKDFYTLFKINVDNHLIIDDKMFELIKGKFSFIPFGDHPIKTKEEFVESFICFYFPIEILKEFYILEINFETEEEMFYFKLKYC